MATTKYAINAVQVAGLGLVFPGTLYSDTYDDLVRLAAAGVLLWPSSDAIVAAQAAIVTDKRQHGGISPEDAQGLMWSALASSISANSAQLSTLAGTGGAGLIGLLDTLLLWDGTTLEAAMAEARTLLRLKAPTELTIATGAITVTQSLHKVDTEADAGSDDLDTISGTAEGKFYVLRLENAARNVVLKHGTGNIKCPFAKDITLDAITDWALLISDGTNLTVLVSSTTAANGGGAGALIGLLASLTTTEKGTVVGALNEVDANADTGIAAAAAAQATANAAVPKASVQQASGVMVAGSVTFAGLTLTAGSIVFPSKEIEDPAASGALTVGAITPGAPGSVTITSANGAETSTIRVLVVG